MTTNLPVEVLDKIFTYLPLPQKQECMFVCKQWAQVILSRSIFHTVKVEGPELYDQVKDFFVKSPSHGAMVEYLELQYCIPESFDTRNFLRLFPNAKTIKMTGNKYSGKRGKKPISAKEFVLDSKKSQLETLEDYNECIMTRFLIQNNMCNHLTSLKLFIRNDKSAPNIFPLLKNMPVLKELIIWISPMSFDDFEAIHTNLPLLERLELDVIDILPGSLPPTIVPAVTVTNLAMNFGSLDIRHQVNWPRYVLAKYPNLEHINFWTESTTKDVDVQNYYNKGLEPILQRLGPRLKSLTLARAECYPDIIKKLDVFGCQLKSLTVKVETESTAIMEELVRSKQKDTIEELTLDSPIRSFKWLKNLSKLKKLVLTYFGAEEQPNMSERQYDEYAKSLAIDLDELCDHCPETCESIDFSYGFVKFKANTRKKYHIKELILKTVKLFPANIDKFISKALPDLTSLTLIGCLKKHATLDLSKHHLSFVKLSSDAHPLDNNLELLASDREQCYYARDSPAIMGGFSYLDPYLSPTIYEDLHGSPFITLICASVKTLVLYDLEAYLVSDMEKFTSLNE